MGPHGSHPRVMREVPKELAKPLSINCQQSWLTGEVVGDWKLANVTSTYKKDWKDDPGKYGPLTLTSALGKVIEKIMMSVIKQHMQKTRESSPANMNLLKAGPA